MGEQSYSLGDEPSMQLESLHTPYFSCPPVYSGAPLSLLTINKIPSLPLSPFVETTLFFPFFSHMNLVIQLVFFILVSLRPNDVSALITGTVSCYDQQRLQCQTVLAHCRLMVLLMLRVIVVATVMLAGSLWDDICAIRKGVISHVQHKTEKKTASAHYNTTSKHHVSEKIQDQVIPTTLPVKPSSTTKDPLPDLGKTTVAAESKPTIDKLSTPPPAITINETESCSQEEKTPSIEKELLAEEKQQQQQEQPLASSNAYNDATVTATESSITAGDTAAQVPCASNDVTEQHPIPTTDVVDKQPEQQQQQQVSAVEDETMTQSSRTTSDKQQNNEVIEEAVPVPAPVPIETTPSRVNNEASTPPEQQEEKQNTIATPPPPPKPSMQQHQQTAEAVPAKRHGRHEEEETASSSDETIPTPPEERENNKPPAKNSRLLNMAARAAAVSPQQQQPRTEEPKRSFSLRLNRSSSSNLRAKFDSLVHRNQNNNNSDKPPRRPSKQPFASLSRSLRRSKTPVTSDNASTTSNSTKRLQGTRKRLSNLFQS